MLRAALQPHAVVWIIEPLAARSLSKPLRRRYSDRTPSTPPSTTHADQLARPVESSHSPAASGVRSSAAALSSRIDRDLPPHLRPPAEEAAAAADAAASGDISPEPGKWADEGSSELSMDRLQGLQSFADTPGEVPWPNGRDYVGEVKSAFAKRKGKIDDLSLARLLIGKLVSWPDFIELPNEDVEPPKIEDEPETLHLLQDLLMRMLPEFRHDPFVLLLSLRGFTALAATSPAAEPMRAKTERLVLEQKDSWWATPRSSKLVEEGVDPDAITFGQATICVNSADYLRRHPIYANREDVYSAWDGQPVPAPREFHRVRLCRVLSTLTDRMTEGRLVSPNSSGLPDLPYNEVRSFLAPGLTHYPHDAFIILSTLHLLAASFNTDVQARLQAAELIDRMDPYLVSLAHPRSIEPSLPNIRAVYEQALKSLVIVRPLLGPEQKTIFEPAIRKTYGHINHLEADQATGRELLARAQTDSEAPDLSDAGGNGVGWRTPGGQTLDPDPSPPTQPDPQA